jgi:hypothetical protein
MAAETAIHRWDAQCTNGQPDPLDPTLAALGVDEALQLDVADPLKATAVGGSGERLTLRTYDVTKSWGIRLMPDAVLIETVPGEADATLVGSAADLWLYVMGRGRDGLRIVGRSRTIERFDRLLESIPKARL